MNFSVRLKESNLYAPAGHEVAWQQLTIRNRGKLADITLTEADGKLKITQSSSTINISNDNVAVRFSKTTSMLLLLKFGDTNILANNKGFVYDNHRYIENDKFTNTNSELQNATPTMTISPDSSYVTVTATRNALCPYTLKYEIYANGTVDLTATFNPNTEGLRRIGLLTNFAAGLENVYYYARGEWENYIDRKESSPLGRYTTTVTEMNEHYIKPQSMGNREDLRELRLTDKEGNGIKIETEGKVAFSTLHHTDEALMNARHEWELTPLSYTVAHFDYMQRGLGNASCGPGTISEYQCPSSGTYSYKLRMTSAAKSLNTAIRPQTTTEKIKVVYQRENNSVKCQGTIEANSAICLLYVSGQLIDQHFM